MIAIKSQELKNFLEKNKELNDRFHDLIDSFSKRIMTPQVCYFFKALCEALFIKHNIPIKVNIITDINGNGRFEIEFL